MLLEEENLQDWLTMEIHVCRSMIESDFADALASSIGGYQEKPMNS